MRLFEITMTGDIMYKGRAAISDVIPDDVKDIPKKNITEGISPIVYHFTRGPSNALSILKQNRFRLTASTGTKAERLLNKRNKQYYLSTTRRKLGGYHLQTTDVGVMFNLDGRKFAQNYTGQAASYWGPEFYGAPGTHKKGFEQQESEDRIYSDDPFIPNAKKYIQEIHVMFTPRGQEKRSDMGTDYRRLFIAAKSMNIPIYLYDNEKNWLLQDKRKTINPAKVAAIAKGNAKEKDQRRMFSQTYKHYLGQWIELYKAPVGSKLSDNAQRVKREVLYGYGDLHLTLASEIHNSRTKPADETGLETLLQIFRKEKISNPQEFIDLLKDKWAPK